MPPGQCPFPCFPCPDLGQRSHGWGSLCWLQFSWPLCPLPHREADDKEKDEEATNRFHSHCVPLSWSWNLPGTPTSWVTMTEFPTNPPLPPSQTHTLHAPCSCRAMAGQPQTSRAESAVWYRDNEEIDSHTTEGDRLGDRGHLARPMGQGGFPTVGTEGD